MRESPEIAECDWVTGEECFFARAHGFAHAHIRSVVNFEKPIDEAIPYAMTDTSIVQSSSVNRRLPPIVRRDKR